MINGGVSIPFRVQFLFWLFLRRPRARGGAHARVTRGHLGRLAVLLAELGEKSRKKIPKILHYLPKSLSSLYAR